jgi:hypothetical protein
MISSLDEALVLLHKAMKEGKPFCLALSDKSSSLWLSAGQVRSIDGARFEFSVDAGGEPVVATINLRNCEFVNQKPTDAPDTFQSSMALADIPVLQAKLESGRLLEMFEENTNQE